MTTGDYTGVPAPELNRQLDLALTAMANDISALNLPGIAGVVLGGGYGRGEGGVRHTPQGDKLYNDLDFFVFGNQASRRQKQDTERALKDISRTWKERLGIDVDFSPVKNLTALSRVSSTLMYQELLRGWRPVWGDVRLEDWIPALEPQEIPFTEAVRLLLNRGMGLVFAGEKLAGNSREEDFIVRNMNKAVLGCGDALLLAAGKYCWTGRERVTAFNAYAKAQAIQEEYADAYSAAFNYKLEPEPVLPPAPLEHWASCRRFYLETVRRVAGATQEDNPDEVSRLLGEKASGERSFRNFLRWLLGTKTLRPLPRLFDAPVVTALASLFELLSAHEAPPPCPPQLYRVWQRFN